MHVDVRLYDTQRDRFNALLNSSPYSILDNVRKLSIDTSMPGLKHYSKATSYVYPAQTAQRASSRQLVLFAQRDTPSTSRRHLCSAENTVSVSYARLIFPSKKPALMVSLEKLMLAVACRSWRRSDATSSDPNIRPTAVPARGSLKHQS